MENFNLLQIVPSLNSGGVEQGTIDVANFLGERNLEKDLQKESQNSLKILALFLGE